MATKRTLKTRTYEEKLRIIEYAERHSDMKRKDVAFHFGMSQQTLSDIMKNKVKITTACASDNATLSTVKRQKVISHPEVDKALLVWFAQMSPRSDIRIDGSILLHQANTFRLQFSPESQDEILPAWVDRFKKRHGIVRAQRAREFGGVGVEVVREWKGGKLVEILNSFHARDIYSARETGLYWLLTPDNYLGFAGQCHHGAKLKEPESRITILVGANMDGTDKLPLFVIGKSPKPRAFENVNVPVEFVANEEAWMTGGLFESWLRRLDYRMRLENRRIALILDTCPAHPYVELSNITLLFLPPNTTSHTQPMDSGIIQNLKYHYRHLLALRSLEAAECTAPFTWSILDSVIALKSAWKRVRGGTINNCFKKAGFQKARDITDPETTEQTEAADPVSDMSNIWNRLRDLYGDAVPSDVEAYVLVDEHVRATSVLSDEQLVANNREHSRDDATAGSDDEAEADIEPLPAPNLSEAYAALRTLRHYGLQSCPQLEVVTDEVEAVLMRQSQSIFPTKKLYGLLHSKVN